MNKKTGEHSRVLQRSLHYMEERCVKLPSILFTLGFPPRRFRPAQIVSGTFILNRLIFSQCFTYSPNKQSGFTIGPNFTGTTISLFLIFFIFLDWFDTVILKIKF
jgi:hypothetical protein